MTWLFQPDRLHSDWVPSVTVCPLCCSPTQKTQLYTNPSLRKSCRGLRARRSRSRTSASRRSQRTANTWPVCASSRGTWCLWWGYRRGLLIQRWLYTRACARSHTPPHRHVVKQNKQYNAFVCNALFRGIISLHNYKFHSNLSNQILFHKALFHTGMIINAILFLFFCNLTRSTFNKLPLL